MSEAFASDATHRCEAGGIARARAAAAPTPLRPLLRWLLLGTTIGLAPLAAVSSPWVLGILLDIAYGTLLGQHAMALALVIYITVKFHLQLRVFPVSQMTATVLALLALYQFVLFWINGIAGIYPDAVIYWGPVVSGTLLWPVVSLLLGGVRYRAPG